MDRMASRHSPQQHGSPSDAKIIRFDRFQLDLRSGEMHKEGRRVRLQPQPFQLLVLLLLNAGRIVTREDVRRELWPEDTFVDFDHGLAVALSKLREAISDSSEKPRFVETVPRRGYRFIGAVTSYENLDEVSKAMSVPEAPSPTMRHLPRPSLRRFVVIAMLCVGAIVVVAALGVSRRRSERADPPESGLRPFTALPGIETSPAFSPDGSRVAFAWNGSPNASDKGFDLYVKAIGSETQLRLTRRPSDWLNPAWSPDGTRIAFHRLAGIDTGVYVISALGGPERKLTPTRIPYNVATGISWSPDGRWIAFGDHSPNPPTDHLFLVSVDTLEVRPLAREQACLGEADPIFSHDGKTIFFTCVHSANSIEIHSLPTTGGSPTVVLSPQNVMVGFALNGDDSRIVFSHFGASGQRLSVASLKDHSVRLIEGAEGGWPAISPSRDQLAYSSDTGQTSIWRRDLLHTENPPTKILSSSRSQNVAQYSPDGKHIAFESDRGGYWAVWMSDADGENLVQVSKEIRGTGMPRWSPDGRRIAFDTSADTPSSIYIVDIAEEVPRKLKSDVEDIKMPSWSHDGNLIYFTSNDMSQGHATYRIAAEGGTAERLPSEPYALRPIESPDGAFLYLASREVSPELERVTLSKRPGNAVSEAILRVRDSLVWDVTPGGIYFVPADSPKTVRYFDFGSHGTREVFKIEKDFDSGFSVSPDGRYLLYSQVDEENADIMLMDRY
jgi:Tol biopolymer transport system component/DNA-binding winged helix-turn-helix (wHTH) protein